MIKLISKKISENLTYGQRSLRNAKIFEMDAYKTKHLNPEVKRKSSFTDDHSKKQKYRKKKKISNENKLSHAMKNKPYTWFLALPISNSGVHSELKRAQEQLFGIDVENSDNIEGCVLGPEYHPAAVPISKSHITLFLFNADGEALEDYDETEIRDQRLNVAIDAIKEAVSEYQFWVKSRSESLDPLTIRLKRVGHFNDSVIFATPKFVENEHFEMLWKTLRKHLIEKKFLLENDPKQHTSSFADFSPHVTLLKMSRIYKQNRNKRRKKDEKQIVPRKFPKGCTDNMKDKYFGDQSVDRIELLSLTKEGQKGGFSYYFCQEEFLITQDPNDKGANCYSEHSYCCSPLAFPHLNYDSSESETEKSTEAEIARRKIALEKENARKSIRTSMLSVLKSTLGLDAHKSQNNTSLNTENDLSEYKQTSNAKNAIFFVAGSFLTIAAMKILFNRLSR